MKFKTILELQENYDIKFEKYQKQWRHSAIDLEHSLNPANNAGHGGAAIYNLDRLVSLQEKEIVEKKNELVLNGIVPIIGSGYLEGINYKLEFDFEELNLLVPLDGRYESHFSNSLLDDTIHFDRVLRHKRPRIHLIESQMDGELYGKMSVVLKDYVDLRRPKDERKPSNWIDYFNGLLEIKYTG